MDLLSLEVANHFLLNPSLTKLLVWNLDLLWSLLLCRLLLLQWSFLLLQIISLSLLFTVKIQNQTNLFIHVYFSSQLLKIEHPQKKILIFIVFSNYFKSCFKLRQQRRYLRRRIIISRRWKWWTSLWKPKLQKQNVEKTLSFSSSLLLFFCLQKTKTKSYFVLCRLYKCHHLVSCSDVSLSTLGLVS